MTSILPVAPAATLIDVLRHRASEAPDRILYRFLADGERETESVSRAGLLSRVARVAARLQEVGLEGDPVLLLFPAGIEFITAFLACLHAGCVAIPAYPPRRRGEDARLRSIAEDAEPRAVLTTASLLERRGAVCSLSAPGLAERPWLALDDARRDSGSPWRSPEIDPEALAFLQYTSGSTAAPKGVMVSHGNLVHNERLIQRAFGTTDSSIVVGWLPMYHDMGLIGTVLQPLYCGGEAVLMPPVTFLQKPVRWLRAIARYGADTSGGPDFAYDLCTRRVADDDIRQLDLSSWRVAFNGAEPIRARTLAAFSERFGPRGFRREALAPCYGLAEATLLVSGGKCAGAPVVRAVSAAALEQGLVRPDADGRLRRLVSSGVAADGLHVLVVEPRGREACAEGEVGEVWVHGASVAQGYWDKPEETRETFQACLATGEGPFLRTGDLGFLADGELYVTGRIKDLIIVRGANHYPQDLERSAQDSHAGLQPGGGAAFSIDGKEGERVVLVHELGRTFRGDPEEIAVAVRNAVFRRHRLRIHDLVLIRTRALPRTTSGKIRRLACRDLYLAEDLPVVARSTFGGPEEALGEFAEAAEGIDREILLASPRKSRWEPVRDLLRSRVAEVVGAPPDTLPTDRSLAVLGLDSLAAFDLRQRLEGQLGAGPSLDSLLGGSTIDELAGDLLRRLEKPEREKEGTLATPGDQREAGPLSHGQRALWFLQKLAPESGAYHLVLAAAVLSDVGAECLHRAFQALIARHAGLRTRFPIVESEPVQEVVSAGKVDAWFGQETVPPGLGPAFQERLSAESRRPFNLERGPPIRVRVYERTGEPPVLLLVVHHIVADLWSLAVLGRELAGLVVADQEQVAAALPSPGPGPIAYARQERARLAGPEGERLSRFWRDELPDELPVLDLPTDRPPPASRQFAGGTLKTLLGPDLSRGLDALSRARGATPFSTLLAVYASWLHRYGGQDRLIVGAPVANRASPEEAHLVGYLANPLPLHIVVEPGSPFERFLLRVHSQTARALEHHGYPFGKLVETLQLARESGRPPVFQTLFSFQSALPGFPQGLGALALGLEGERVDLGGLLLESVAVDPGAARFDLALTAARVGERTGLALEYDQTLFDPTTAGRMLRSLSVLAEAVVADPARPVMELPLLGAGERAQLLVEWNDTAAARASAEGLDALIRTRAEETPDAVAAVGEARALSYRALAERSRALANRLRLLGIGAEDLVGVLLEPSLEALVALLGIVESGSAYLPLDPSYPAERLDWMIRASGIDTWVTRPGPSQELPGLALRRVELDLDAPPLEGAEAEPWEVPRDADRLAYVIYTSGSTGRPKGVQVTHRALVNFLLSMAREPGLRREDAILALTPLSFDIAALELFLPLVVGGRVVLAPREATREGGWLARELAAQRVTVAQATPATWKLLRVAGWVGESHLKVLCGGEALPVGLAAWLTTRADGVWNLYGPTETTVWSVAYRLRGSAEEAATVPIGRPVDNTVLHVVSPSLSPVPVGVPGEVLIGGEGVARGYLRRPALTAARFVPDPLSTVPGARLYRTGDRARWCPRSLLEFLGRLDRQVKVRGVRIEPGEVEAVLARHAAVREAVVIAPADGSGERRLVAYFVPERGHAPTEGELRVALLEALPESVVPATYVLLDEMPLSPNSKIDRGRLPAPPRAREPAGVEAGPGDGIESLVAEIWRESLGLEQVGRHESFFALGGHSLLAARLVARLREAVGVDVPVREVFRRPTLSGFAEVVAGARGERGGTDWEPIAATDRSRPLPLSFEQERLWSFESLDPPEPAYNMPAAFELTGRLDRPALSRCLTEVLRRHETLRTRFLQEGGTPRQVVVPVPAPSLPLVDLCGLPAALREAEGGAWLRRLARRRFDLGRAPLLSAVLFARAADLHDLSVVTHHIVADARSIEIFGAELASLYRSLAGEERLSLPPPTVQYGDFAVWQRGWEERGGPEPDLEYWEHRLVGGRPPELPTDRPRSLSPRFRGASRSSRVPLELAALARRHGVTPFMALAALFQVLLGRRCGSPDVSFGVPVGGRDRPELQGLIGFFVNTLVLRVEVPSGSTLGQLMTRVREAVLEVYDHRNAPLRLLAERLEADRDLVLHPLFRVVLAPDQDLPAFAAAGVRAVGRSVEAGTSKFDLSLFAGWTEESVRLRAEFDLDLFDRSTVARMLAQLGVLLTAAAATPEARVGDLPWLPAAERSQLLTEWSGRLAPAGSGTPRRLAHELVDEQARLRPDAAAVTWRNRCLTFGELQRRAARLGERLVAEGVAPGDLVAVLLDRSPSLVMAQLAILNAGAAFVSVDPRQPALRIASMVRRSGADVLVARDHASTSSDGVFGARRVIDPAADVGTIRDGLVKRHAPRPEDLAYVIFTSGSTGEPKGVAISHRGLADLAAWHRTEYGLRPDDRATQIASPGFDASVWEVWPTLAAGATLCVVPQEVVDDPGTLPSWLSGQRVTSSFLPTPLAEGVLSSPWPRECALRHLLTGGDRLRRSPAHPLPFALVNHYGPTECTVVATAGQVAAGEAGTPAIGRPLPHVELFLHDREARPVALGVPGEVCLGGAALARGYVAAPRATAERFVPHPRGLHGSRIYRTGDLARFRIDGTLEFLGRIDDQVKIRGQRVELGEIEAALCRRPGVRDAAVAVVPGEGRREPRLAAYWEGDGKGQPAAAELAAYLAAHLPAAMVPVDYVRVPALPLTPNGKVDRRRLPDLDGRPRDRVRDYVAPRSELETLLAAIWEELLGVERVSVVEDFFSLGGHSLVATRLVARIHEELGVEISPRILFEASTVAGLAVAVTESLIAQSDPAAVADAFQELEKIDGARDAMPAGAATLSGDSG